MTQKSWGIGALIIIILGAVAFIVFKHDTGTPAGLSATATSTYQWWFADKSQGDATPQTQVTLVSGGKSYVIGTYEGTCAEMSGDYLQYEKSKVICWFAGGGHEVGVFEEPGQVVVRVGEVDEGASGVPGFRGNFVLAKTLSI
jgi:hypothetical protein